MKHVGSRRRADQSPRMLPIESSLPEGGIGEIIASDHNMAAFAQGKAGCSSHLPDSGRLPATFDDPGGSPDRRLPFGGGTD